MSTLLLIILMIVLVIVLVVYLPRLYNMGIRSLLKRKRYWGLASVLFISGIAPAVVFSVDYFLGGYSVLMAIIAIIAVGVFLYSRSVAEIEEAYSKFPKGHVDL